MRIDGKKVRDADEPLEIVVRPKHIAKGKVKDPGKCVMALAIKEQYRTADAKVYLSRAYVKPADGGEWLRYIVPGVMERETVAFDRGGKFEPGVYRLRAPKKSLRLDAVRKSYPKAVRKAKVPQRGNRMTRQKNNMVVGVRPHGPSGW